MYNCYKTVSDLISSLPALGSYLAEAGNYLAHRPREATENRLPETLEAHVNLVNEYLVRLVEAHGLDPVIDRLIQQLSLQVSDDKGEYIKCLFVNAIVFHDFGKINEFFQSEKMLNPLFKHLNNTSIIGSTHSMLGAFIFLSFYLNDIINNRNQDLLLIRCCLYFSYSIFKHHSKKLDDNSKLTLGFAQANARGEMEDLRRFLSKYLKYYRFDISDKIVSLIGNQKALDRMLGNIDIASFPFYSLCKLNFSLLTAADYLATHEYMSCMEVSEFGVLTKERINEIYSSVTSNEWTQNGKRNYNKLVYDTLHEKQFIRPTHKGGENLNKLRAEMARQVIIRARKYSERNLFYIEAPTGGGKTNLSLLATIELLKIHEGKYNKVFYVFPFTTLINQTFDVAGDMLGLKEEEMASLHSRAGFRDSSEVEDGVYAERQMNYVNHLFANFPFCFLSHIKFFDILKTNEKEQNFLLHRIANSIVVIDELQSYSPSHWDKIMYFIRQYASLFNIKFIIMSATLPKIDKLLTNEKAEEMIYLLPEARMNYFSNPNFSDRVDFNFDLFERTDLELEELAEKLIDASKKYADYDFGPIKPINSVYTIAEFIFKQSATDFYQVVKEYNFFDEIFVLSGTILDFRRREIIYGLKHPSYRTKKVLLITTQVVEAGVDIDMDIGFKDRSIIDSDEQLAGRINRNVMKDNCTLYLFNYDRESVIYGRDKRFEITRKGITTPEYRRILKEKDFDALYDQVISYRNLWNNRDMVENIIDYLHLFNLVKFESVHEEFKLIDQKNISCFIPLDIPVAISIGNSSEKLTIFSRSELSFLAQNNIYPTTEGTIKGEDVFDLYLFFIHNKVDFLQQRIRLKLLQGIVSKYVFSIFSNETINQQLFLFCNPQKSEYGYLYLERYKAVYSIDGGLDAKKLGGIEETQFL